MAPADPILGVAVAFNADPSPLKINLGIGAYRTSEGMNEIRKKFQGNGCESDLYAGKPLVLRCIRAAEQKIVSDMALNKEYLPVQVDFVKTNASSHHPNLDAHFLARAWRRFSSKRPRSFSVPTRPW